MPEILLTPRPAGAAIAPPSHFLDDLALQVRAVGGAGVREGMTNGALLAAYVLSPEQRRALPLMANPTPQVLARIEMFYAAAALGIERETGVMVQALMQMHPEGFGRMVLLGGRLVVVSKTLRDVHRFGFASFDALHAEGEKLVAQGVDMVRRFPDAARFA